MDKRQSCLERIRICIMKGDERGAMRIYVENRCVSHSAYSEITAQARRKKDTQS